MQQMPPVEEPEPFPSDPASAYHRYNQSLQLVLMDFQFIEEALRMCLVRDYALIYFRTRDVFKFKPPKRELEKDALGRLISKFEQFSEDTSLISELRQLQPFRNKLAHQGMLLTVDEQKDVRYLAKHTKEIEEKRTNTRECLNRLLAEWQRLEAILNDPSRRDQIKSAAQQIASPSTEPGAGET